MRKFVKMSIPFILEPFLPIIFLELNASLKTKLANHKSSNFTLSLTEQLLINSKH